MTNIGRGIAITGTVESHEPLAIGGKIKGNVIAADFEVTLEANAEVDGAIMARTIVIQGTSSGRLVAKDLVRVKNGARVRAEIAAPRFALEEGAVFNGKVDPGRADAAFAVGEHKGALPGAAGGRSA